MDDSRPHLATCRACGRSHAEDTWDDTAWERIDRHALGERVGPAVSATAPVPDDGCEGGGADGTSAERAAPHAIFVEQNVLVCCNGAYDRAAASGRGEVRLLDLLHVVAGMARLEAWLVAYDIDRDLLRFEIEALEAQSPDRAIPGVTSPATSAAMKRALGEARDGAHRRRAASVGIGDLLLAIVSETIDEAGMLLADHISRQRHRRSGGLRTRRLDGDAALGPLAVDAIGGGSAAVGSTMTGGGRSAVPDDVSHIAGARTASLDSRLEGAADRDLDVGYATARQFGVAWSERDDTNADTAATAANLGMAIRRTLDGPGAAWSSDDFPPVALRSAQADGASVFAGSGLRAPPGATGEIDRSWEVGRSWGGDPSREVDTSSLRSGGAMSVGADQEAARLARTGFAGVYQRGSSGLDDLYRPGEREPSDGWYDPAPPAAVRVGVDLDLGREVRAALATLLERTRTPAMPDTLLIRLAEWQSEMAARLDEQDLKLESIDAQLTGLSVVTSRQSQALPVDADADDALDVTTGTRGPSAPADPDADDEASIDAWRRSAGGNAGRSADAALTASGSANASSSSPGSVGSLQVSAARSSSGSAATTMAGTSSRAEGAARAGAGGKPRPYLDRAAIRNEMRRTASRRRRARASAPSFQPANSSQSSRSGSGSRSQSAAAYESGFERRSGDRTLQDGAMRGIAHRESGAPASSRISSQGGGEPGERMRMSVPVGKLGSGRGDSSPRGGGRETIKAAFLRPPQDDDDSDDIDGGAPQKRFYLSLDDDVVEAPSIGPKTAERLREHGIATVRDLLSVKAAALAQRVGVRHITAERVTSWQHQARLVCTIPWLRGTHAQILVGSGYYAPHSIVTANRDALCTAILRFSTTREGQSVLRSAAPPSLGKIMRWVEQAGMAEPERGDIGMVERGRDEAGAGRSSVG